MKVGANGKDDIIDLHLLCNGFHVWLKIGKRLGGSNDVADLLPIKFGHFDDLFGFERTSPFFNRD